MEPVRSSADGWAGLVDRAARELFAAPSPGDVLARAVGLVGDLVPGAGSVSITVLDRRQQPSTVAATSELARTGDGWQYDLDEGPCLDAARSAVLVHSARLEGEDRWPRWRPRVLAELDVTGMMSVPMLTHEQQLGTINVYASGPAALHDSAVPPAVAVAVLTSFAYASHVERSHLRTGLASRNLIGQAQGVLMERHKITAERAFGLLVGASQSANTKLVEIARQVVETGLDPGRVVR